MAKASKLPARREPRPPGDAGLTAARLQIAKAKRTPWETTFQECYDYAMPAKEGIWFQAPGTVRTTNVYDETAIVAAQECMNRLQGGIAPPFSRWVDLEAGSDIEDQDQRDEANSALGAVTTVFFECINQSNFVSELSEALLDMLVGTGCLYADESFDPSQVVTFRAIPLSRLWLDVGPDDRLDSYFFLDPIKPEHIRVRWPQAQLPDRLAALIADNYAGKTGACQEVVELILHVRRDWTQPEETHILEVFSEADKAILWSETLRGVGSCPFIGFRWSKIAGEVWGRGPLLNAMPAIKTCNLVVQLVLENAEMAITGIYTMDDGQNVNVDTIELIPGTIVPRGPGTKGLEVVQTAGNFDVAQLVLADMRTNIRKALFNEQMGNPLGGKTPLSATEVAERQADLAKQIGSSFGRLMVELVNPVVNRVVYILKGLGRISLPAINGRDVAIKPTSPLSRAQSQQDIGQLGRFMQDLNAMFGPQVAGTVVKPEEAAPWLAEKYGIPRNLIREPKDAKAAGLQDAVMATSPDPTGVPLGV